MAEEKDKLLVCPHCGNKTPHRLLLSHSCPAAVYGSDGNLDDDAPFECLYQIFECSTCRDLSVLSGLDMGDELDLVYPAGASLDKSVPELVAANYREAKRVQNVSPNAYAVLIRSALEALCDDRGVAAGNLYSRLEKLSKKGEIPPILTEITSVLRTLGNLGAHSTAEKVTVPTTWKMDKFFITLVEYVYVAPARLAEYRETVTKKKKV